MTKEITCNMTKRLALNHRTSDLRIEIWIKDPTQCTSGIGSESCLFVTLQIALQFPDSLLADSAAVASLIEKNTGKKVFVLADTSYGRYPIYLNRPASCVNTASKQYPLLDGQR